MTPTKPDENTPEDENDASDDDYGDMVNALINKDELPNGVFYSLSRKSFFASPSGSPTTKKEFMIRKRAASALDEIEFQRKRALHYFQTNVVLPTTSLAKRT